MLTLDHALAEVLPSGLFKVEHSRPKRQSVVIASSLVGTKTVLDPVRKVPEVY